MYPYKNLTLLDKSRETDLWKAGGGPGIEGLLEHSPSDSARFPSLNI